MSVPSRTAHRSLVALQHLIRWMARQEITTLLAILVVSGGLWGFIELAEDVSEGDTRQVDRAVLMWMRTEGNPADPVGPEWFEDLARDFTSFGSVGVLIFLTLGVTGYLWLDRKRLAILLFLAITAGHGVSFLAKSLTQRERPDTAWRTTWTITHSFPSGHAMMSAATYLTMAAVVARSQRRKRLRAYYFFLAIIMSFLVGASRVYLGVHWPTDVLAGWTLGTCWAILCWLVVSRWIGPWDGAEGGAGDGQQNVSATNTATSDAPDAPAKRLCGDNFKALSPLAGYALAALLVLLAANGCMGRQSALDPAGTSAEAVSNLFWWMVGSGIAIWSIFVALLIYAAWGRPVPHHPKRTAWLVIGGGAVVPTLLLTVLVVFGSWYLPTLVAKAPPDSLQVEVHGARWWWRVRYLPHGQGEPIELANEIRLPVGQPVQFHLETEDVIHAFWIPSLGGKVDMLPGRRTALTLHPTRTGVYRGACAEYCGGSHAFMKFDVLVVTQAEFDAWLRNQAAGATSPTTRATRDGQRYFLTNGCGACHTVRGTPAQGTIGPDLTHVGGRLTLAAGTLENEHASLVNWIAQPQHYKPEAQMPPFGMLPADQLNAIAEYLQSLQ